MSHSGNETVTILSEGAWGTACALLLAHNNFRVRMWCHSEAVAHEIRDSHSNRTHFPEITLPDTITATTDLAEAVENSSWIFEAIPVQFLSDILLQLKPHLRPDHKFAILSKGIDTSTLLLPTNLIQNTCGNYASAVIMGPSFAYELARKQLTAVTLAGTAHVTQELYGMLKNDFFMPHISTDIIGTQLCGSLKNVITLMMGILDGAGHGDNIKAYAFTRGLAEIGFIVTRLGGQQETVYYLAGLGDLVLTSLGKHSKNLRIGRELGMGKPLDQLLKDYQPIPEGINTLKALIHILEQYSIEAPLCKTLHAIIFQQHSVASLIQTLTAPCHKGYA